MKFNIFYAEWQAEVVEFPTLTYFQLYFLQFIRKPLATCRSIWSLFKRTTAQNAIKNAFGV